MYLPATSRHTKCKHVKLFSRERTVLLKTGETNSITKNGREKYRLIGANIWDVNTLYFFQMSGMKLFLKLYNLTQWITAQNPLRCIVFFVLGIQSNTMRAHLAMTLNLLTYLAIISSFCYSNCGFHSHIQGVFVIKGLYLLSCKVFSTIIWEFSAQLTTRFFFLVRQL